VPNKYEPDTHTLNQIDALFAYHTPHGDQTERFARVRAAFKAAALEVVACCPHSPERTLALRDLQRGMMMSNASIAVKEPG
jgi:hypothetical protein